MVGTRAPEVGAGRGQDLLDRVLAGTRGSPVTHVEQVPARAGRAAEWPQWAPQLLVDRLAARGITRPWKHQAAAAAWCSQGRVIPRAANRSTSSWGAQSGHSAGRP